jgi:hypothetical protein
MAMTADDLPHEYPFVYFIPQTCGCVLEFRCKSECKPSDFSSLLGSACHWHQAEDMGIQDPPDEFRSQWRGGAQIRKCPFTVVELKELSLMEAEVSKDGPDPAPK